MSDDAFSAVTGGPRRLLRIEGLVLLAVAGVAYHTTGASWWMFAALFLVPDLGMLAYLAGPRIGAMGYNAAHATIGPALVAGIGFAVGWSPSLPLAAIWAAHIGFDRAMGYGLKYASGFADTHLGRVGRGGKPAS